MNEPRLHAPSVVLATLVAAVLLNLGQGIGVNYGLSPWYQAVHIKQGHDLRTLAATHFDGTQERFLLAVQLRDLAPGSTIVLPTSVSWREEDLIGLAGVTTIERVGEVSPLDADTVEQLDAATVAAGTDHAQGPYAIVLDPGTAPDRLVVVPGPDRLYVVDEALAGHLGVAVAP